jgi:hypothetical protein
MDLVRLWEDHRFIAELADRRPTTYPTSPTYKFDSIYREILCQNADLLFLLRSKIIKTYDLAEIVYFMGPQYNPQVFQSFLSIRELFRLPLNGGDWPVDFLADPRRAGDLYLHPHHISEDLVLLWINHTKTRLAEGDLDFTR